MFSPHSEDLVEVTSTKAQSADSGSDPERNSDRSETSSISDQRPAMPTSESLPTTSTRQHSTIAGTASTEEATKITTSNTPNCFSSVSSGRTLSGVIKGLKRIIDRKGKAYRDSDFRQYWMPDSNCKECYECGKMFNPFRRRHHCRICGQIFCSACCSQEVPGKTVGQAGSLRCCNYCMTVVTQYISDIGLDGRSSFSIQPHSSGSPKYPHRNPLSVDSQTKSDGLSGMRGDPTSGVGTGGISSIATLNSLVRRPSNQLRSSIFDEDLKGFNVDDGNLVSSPVESLQKERKALLQEACQLHDLWFSMRESIPMQNVRFLLKSYDRCIAASHIVDWFIENDKALTREQAAVLGQALLDGKWLESIDGKVTFRDNARVFYRPTEMAMKSKPSLVNFQTNRSGVAVEEGEPLWVKEILRKEDGEIGVAGEHQEQNPIVQEDHHSHIHLSHHHHHLMDATAGVDEMAAKSVFYLDFDCPSKDHGYNDTAPDDINRAVDKDGDEYHDHGKDIDLEPALAPRSSQDLTESSPEDDNKDKFKSLLLDHLNQLTNQLLNKRHIDTGWAETIFSIGSKVTNSVKPNTRLEDEMDIRHYLKIKKIPGNDMSNWQMVNGVVFSKNVTHKKMRHSINNPRILLISAPIEYQRIENKMSSLEPQILQEREFLKKCVHRIMTMKPDLVLVEKSVSRIAQEYLYEAGITLVINVKQSVLLRVARMTQASIVSSIDGLVNKTNLGTCSRFHLQTFLMESGISKTLMFLDGCDPTLGCSVILRGGLLQELQRVKETLEFIIYAMYHMNFELSFLLDEHAHLPKVDLTSRFEPVRQDGFTGCSNSGQAQNQDLLHLASNTTSNYPCDSPCEHPTDTSLGKETPKITLESKDVNGEPKQERKNFIGQKSQSIAEDDNNNLSLKKHFREQKFLDCLSGRVLLSISPNVTFKLPFLETKDGRASALRTFFNKGDLYWSKELEDDSNEDDFDERLCDGSGVVKPVVNGENQEGMKFGRVLYDSGGLVLESHPFVYGGIGSSPSSVQNLLADFRARGGKPLVPSSANKNHSYFSQSKILSKNNPTSYNEKETDNTDNLPGVGLDSLDCLIPENHQRISVLFTSISLESANFPSPCVLPWVVTMNFYSHTDITLGGFLEKFCYNENYRCVHAHCETPMKEHVRRFVHNSGCLQVTLKKIESPSLPLLPSASSMSSLSAGGGGSASSGSTSAGSVSAVTTKMWSYCKLCLQKTPVTPMSPETYGLSFGKYLELRFYAHSYINRPGSKCNHSLHQDYVQIFDCGLLRAAFKYSFITILNIYLPPMVITILPVRFSPKLLGEEGAMLKYRVDFCFETITENLLKLRKELAFSDNQHSLVVQHVKELEYQKQGIDQKAQYVLSLVNSLEMLGNQKGNSKANSSLGTQISDAFVDIHRDIAATIQVWTEKLTELETTLKKSEKSSKSFSSSANLSSFVSPVATTTVLVSPQQNAQTDGSLISKPSLHVDQFNATKVTSPSSTTTTASKVSKSNTTPTQISTLALDDDLPATTDKCTNSAENDKTKSSIKKTSSYPISLTNSTLITDKPTASKPSAVDPDVFMADHITIAEESTLANVGQNKKRKEGISAQSDEWNTRDALKAAAEDSNPSVGDLRNDKTFSIYEEINNQNNDEIKRNISTDQFFNEVKSPREQPISSYGSRSEKEGISIIIGAEDSIVNDDVVATFGGSGSRSCDGGSTSLSSIASVPPSCKKHFEEVFIEDAATNKSTPVPVDNTTVVDGSSVAKLVSKKGKISTSSKESSIMESSSDKKVNMKQILSNFLSNSVTCCINDPIPSDEHHLLPECLKVPVVVYDKEPSSIIAYALSSKEYDQKMKELKMKLNEHLNSTNSDLEEGKKQGAILSFLKNRDKSPSRSDFSVTSSDVGGIRNFDRIDTVRYVPQYDLEEKETLSEDSVSSLSVPHSQSSKLQKVPTSLKAADVKAQQQQLPSEHIELQFSDNSTKFYCKVCFAEQFESLRKIIFPEGEESFIRSLSRCIPWFARGGRSGSNFCKTQDNRFILKQMSLREVQSFGPFARHYFTHILECCRSGKPTTIAKIVGVFKVVYQNSKTSETLNQDLLIMENLFYNHKILQIYDLKGSTRNRMVNTCGKKHYEDLVLLDENLIRAMVDSPLYVHTHSKLILMSAITRDSEFLANHLIMDYSLLVGVDEENELVVGIIDYIRTFTWDKRVEMIVKTTYGSKMPTVVSPEVYRRRFLDAMDRYFLAVPDKWKGLGKNLADALV